MKITNLTSKEVSVLLNPKKSALILSLTNLKHGEGVLIHRRELMRSQGISSVKEIPSKIKVIGKDNKLNLGVKQVLSKTLIYKK